MSVRNKLFVAHGHQDKGQAYIEALEAAGWQRMVRVNRAAFCLLDYDNHPRGRYYMDHTRYAFMYPHAARPNLQWDIVPIYKPHTACFVIGPGCTRVMRLYGYPYPIHEVGWPYCDIVPFRRRTAERLKVLLAPIHPEGSGLDKVREDTNNETHERLAALHVRGEINLTVRLIGNIEQNGIKRTAPGVSYMEGRKIVMYDQIDVADVVIGHQTFAHVAVARGVPTLMMNEGMLPGMAIGRLHAKFAKTFDKYRDVLKFPLDILDGDALELLRRAASTDEDIAEWREAFIGERFNPELFVSTLESYL